MVGHDTHGNIDLLLLVGTFSVGTRRNSESVFLAREEFYLLDDGLEDVGIVVGVFALQHTHEALKSHTGIDDVHGQRFELAISLAVELHEHNVPNLDYLRIVLVDKFTSGHFCLLLLSTGIDVYL